MEKRDEEFSKLVGSRIRKLRNANNLSVGDLAERAAVTSAQIRSAENGKLSSATLIRRIAEVLHVETHELVDPAISFDYYSVFISYGGPDEKIADRIYRALHRHGIRCFFFPVSATPGTRLHRTMSQGIHEYDRVLLLCSEHSLGRPGVQNEIERVLAKEAAEGGSELLIPIALDDYIFRGWSPTRPDIGVAVRERVVCDFTDVHAHPETWRRQIALVVNALRKTPE